MNCPACDGREVGKIGYNRFYCWICCVEFNAHNQVFKLTDDGSLINTGAEKHNAHTRGV